MAEQMFNTRIILKNDTLANLNASSFIPKKGEMILAEITSYDVNGVAVPTYLIKVGDGINTFANLKFAAAQAADVYAWAKQSSLHITKEGNGNVIADIAWDATLNGGKGGVKIVTASVATSEGLEQLQNRVAELVDSVTAGDNSIAIGGTANDPTVAVKISKDADNAITLEDDGLKVVIPEVTIPVYSIKKAADAGEYAAVYHLQKDGVDVGDAINIPKDMVVSSGEVVEIDGVANIKLVLANANNDEILIPVDSLIEYVTSGSTANDAIQITVSEDHKVTASVKNGALTFDMLADGVKASLGKADTAVQPAAISDMATKTYVAEEIAKIGTGDNKVDNAVNADKAADADSLGGIAAANYLKKTEAPGYDDILTKTQAANDYQPKGSYATAAQGAKADTALQPAALNNYYTKEQAATAAQGAKADTAIQEVAGSDGVKVTKSGTTATVVLTAAQNVSGASEDVWVFDCGTASKNI